MTWPLRATTHQSNMVLKKYENIIREINLAIEKFNLLLAEEFRIAPLIGSNTESCAVLAKGVPWKDQECLPDRLHPGVYILCAHRQSDPNSLGAYLGKSSVGNNISMRLSARLKQPDTTGIYKMTNRAGEPFFIETIVAIGLRNPRMRVLASALEPVWKLGKDFPLTSWYFCERFRTSCGCVIQLI